MPLVNQVEQDHEANLEMLQRRLLCVFSHCHDITEYFLSASKVLLPDMRCRQRFILARQEELPMF